MNKVTCPHCQATIKLIDADPGSVHTCPRCQHRFQAAARSVSSTPPSLATPAYDELFDPSPPAKPLPPAPHPPPKPAPSSGPPSRPIPPPPPPRPAAAKTHSPPPPAPPPPAPQAAVRAPLADDDLWPPDSQPAGGTGPGGGPTSLGWLSGDDVGDGTRPDDAAGAALPVSREADEYRFGCSCPLCATRLDFVSSQIGQQATCPDCFTTFEIRAPGPQQERQWVSDDGFGAPDRLDMESPPEDTRRLDSPDALKQRADQLLQKAAQELAAARRDQSADGFSDSTAVSLFHFLLLPTTWGRMAGLVVLGTLALAPAALATQIDDDGTLGARSLVMLMLAVPLSAIWFTVLSAHALALLEETSAQIADVENWPGANFLEWFGAPLKLGLAVIFAALPGFSLAFLLAWCGLSGFLVGWLVPASIVACLPVVLLSMLYEQSIFHVFSSTVWQRLWSVTPVMATFYQAATLLGIVGWMALMVTWFGSPLLALPQALVIVLVTLLYFRLLGWLAHAMGDAGEE
ncbi:MAG: hypothetical protein U0935_14850 [Pirellulales bacterium]